MSVAKTRCESYKFWCEKVRKCNPFAFTRYGDGEWTAITGHKMRNCDGHTLGNPKMRKQLINSILNPAPRSTFIRSLWMDKQCQPVEKVARRWIPKHANHITWWDGLMFNFANNDGRNFPFINTLRNLKLPIIVIGPQHLRKLNRRVFDYAGFVQVPYRTAYFSMDRILEEALAFEPPVFYSIHAGPPAPIFTWKLWQQRKDSCVIMDLGSIFDGYCGKKTRRAWREFITPKKARANLGEK